MASLLQWRSLLILAIGLILGALVGVGYWYASPLRFQIGWPPVIGLTESPPTLYASTELIEPTNCVDRREIQWAVEDWTWRMNSMPFYMFVAGRLAEEFPWYLEVADDVSDFFNLDEDDLVTARIIESNAQYDIVSRVRVQVIGRSAQEASLLANAVPQLFAEFLIAEEYDMLLQQYEDDLVRVEEIGADLVKARQKVAVLAPNHQESEEASTVEYIVAEAKVRALEGQIETLAATLAYLIAGGSSEGEEYQAAVDSIEMVSADLLKARLELATLEGQTKEDAEDIDIEYSVALAKERLLVMEFDTILSRVAVPPTISDVEQGFRDKFIVLTPTEPEVVWVEKIRGRNAVMTGGVLGLCGALLVIKRRELIGRVRSYVASTAAVDEEEEDREYEE